ncbi:hypothetical protein EXIGLDRAFT_729260 [Exidia glandulosa HHB12029]|uniref:F-box domain-containing protein n=1 Tax=Exidia glandulosa HHB12029 TaxID=1314781 RepID=A0A165CP11_EXIGL|nr:hypothetical protein EXIGLDRAFT_729260 [Exidia glandulosa HHB12029]
MRGDAAIHYDVLELITQWCDVRTLLELCLTSRDARHAAVPLLYREVSIDVRRGPAAEAVMLALVSQPRICLFVQVFRCRGFLEPDETSVLLQLVRMALQQMPRLQVLDLGRCFTSLVEIDEDFSMSRAITKMPSLDTVHFGNMVEKANALLSGLRPMRRIAFQYHVQDSDDTGWTGISALLHNSRETLTMLDVSSWVDLGAVIGSADAQWLSVTHLTVDNPSVALSTRFPNVTSIRVCGGGAADISLLLDPDMFPALTAVQLPGVGHHQLHDGLVPRELQHVTLSLGWGEFPHLEYFASPEHLTSLHLYRKWPGEGSYFALEQLFTSIAGAFPNLHYLGITFLVNADGSANKHGLLRGMAGRGPTMRQLRVLSVRSAADIDFTSYEQLRLRRDVENTFPELELAELNFNGVITHWAWYRVLHHVHSFYDIARRAPDNESRDFASDIPVRPHCVECLDFQRNAPNMR